jgi:sugar/nucleoside kinase (ribokinase family)
MMPGEFDFQRLIGSRILLVDGKQVDAQMAAARHAQKWGVQVVYDADQPVAETEKLIALTDVLIASERFAAEIGSGALAESLKNLSSMGPQTVVVTIGEDGSVGMEKGETYILPAIPVDVVDTFGAGDVFLGSFIYGLVKGWDLRARLQFANAAAGLQCKKVGSREGTPTLAEVRNTLMNPRRYVENTG